MLTTVQLKGNRWPANESASYTTANMAGIAPATRREMRSQSAEAAAAMPAATSIPSDEEAVRIVNATIAEATEAGRLPQLQKEVAARFGLTDKKDIARLWRNLGAELGEVERALAAQEAKRLADAAVSRANYGSRVLIYEPQGKKGKKAKGADRQR